MFNFFCHEFLNSQISFLWTRRKCSLHPDILTLVTTLCCFIPFITMNHVLQMKRLNTLAYRIAARVFAVI